jgi:hypothetical protein
VPGVCALLDVDAGLAAVAGAVIGGFEPFDQPGIETIAAEEIDRHRAAPIAGMGGESSGANSPKRAIALGLTLGRKPQERQCAL